jgi:hypothetical protein
MLPNSFAALWGLRCRSYLAAEAINAAISARTPVGLRNCQPMDGRHPYLGITSGCPSFNPTVPTSLHRTFRATLAGIKEA